MAEGTFFGEDGFTIDDIGGIVDTIGAGWDIVEDITGTTDTADYGTTVDIQETAPAPATTNWWLWGGIGAAIIAIGVFVYVKRKKKA